MNLIHKANPVGIVHETICQIYDGEILIESSFNKMSGDFRYSYKKSEVTCPRCLDLLDEENIVYPTTIFKKQLMVYDDEKN